MSFLHDVWKDTLEIGRDPLFSIGQTELTLLRILGLLLIIVAIQQTAKITKRSITKLHPRPDRSCRVFAKPPGKLFHLGYRDTHRLELPRIRTFQLRIFGWCGWLGIRLRPTKHTFEFHGGDHHFG